MRKAKEKPKRGENSNHLEFVSPMSLHTCVSLIEQIVNLYSGSMQDINAHVKHETLSLEAEKFSFYSGFAVVHVHLTQQDASSTVVVCESGTNRLWILIYIPFLLVTIIGFFAISKEIHPGAGVLFLIPFGMILLTMNFQFYRARVNLLNRIKSILIDR